jgi:hypothetical protein
MVFCIELATSFLDWIPSARHILSRWSWLRSLRPEWFLPRQCILKRQKPEWKEAFVTEKSCYKVLQPLQSTLIPVFYTEATYDNFPAIILSEILGTRLDHFLDSGSCKDNDYLENRFEAVLKKLTEYGVEYADPNLTNFILVDDRIMVIDFELVRFEKTTVWEESLNRANVKAILWEIRALQQGGTFFQAENERWLAKQMAKVQQRRALEHQETHKIYIE